MKYECSLVKDVVSLYMDDALSEKSRESIEEHLSLCGGCRKFYHEYTNDEGMAESENEAKPFMAFSKKITDYRKNQLLLFALVALLFLIMTRPWFGYEGVNAIDGFSVLAQPFGALGVAAFIAAVFYDFKSTKKRMTVGIIGIAAVILSEIYYFLTIPAGTTTGISFGLFGITIPYLPGISLAESFESVTTWFFAGLALTVISAVCFYLFCRKTQK